MAVGIGIAVPGKVLATGDDTILLQAVHIGHTLESHVEFVFSEGTVADDRILWVAVHIDDRCKVHLHAQPFQHTGDLGSGAVDEAVVLHSTPGELTLEAGNRIEPHGGTPLGIHGGEQRNGCYALVSVGEACLSDRTTLHEDESADLIVTDEFADCLLVCGIFVGISRHHEELPDLFLDGHGLHE